MTPPRPSSETEPPAAGVVDHQVVDGAPAAIARRAPFADNPNVGARGQRTQQRILDAALRVFGEVGYHQCNIARITQRAGCSRASFYQYFSSKEDVFRHLAGQLARQLSASTEALDPLTGDLDGWKTIRAWVARHADIYERYEPVYRASQAATESDEAIAVGSSRFTEQSVALIRSKLVTPTLSPRQLGPVILLLLECFTGSQTSVRTLRLAAPGDYPQERVDDALADLVHRTLFGLQAGVNVHPPADRPPRELKFGPVMQDVLQQNNQERGLTAAGRRTLEALMETGRDVFVARGYHNTRVDDIVAAAGVSHGAFYRYFRSKDHLALVLAGRAARTVSATFTDIPDTVGIDGSPARANLRRWLRRYNDAQAAEAAMVRVWVEAAFQDPAMGPESAAVLDWGRRRLVRFLQPRDFGDVDTEAVIMTALLSTFGARERSNAIVEAAAHIIEQGLLGR